MYVTFNRRLGGTAVPLTPGDDQFFPVYGQVFPHAGQGNPGAQVVGVGRNVGHACTFTVQQHLVTGEGGIIGNRHFHIFVTFTIRSELAGVNVIGIFSIPDQAHLFALGLFCHLFQRLATDKLVVKLEHETVPQLIRGQVQFFDVVLFTIVTAADGTGPFRAPRRQPLTILFHLFPCVNRGNRATKPTGLSRRARIDTTADRCQVILLTGFEYQFANGLTFFTGAPELITRRPGHAVVQGRGLVAAYPEFTHFEKRDIGQRAAVYGFQDFVGIGTLYLVAIQPSVGQVRRRLVDTKGLHVVATGCRVVGDPHYRARPAQDMDLVLRFAGQDCIADHETIIVTDDQLFGLHGAEVAEAVYCQALEQFGDIRAL